MPRGYEEGPVADAAQARRDALERGGATEPERRDRDRRAVYGSTALFLLTSLTLACWLFSRKDF